MVHIFTRRKFLNGLLLGFLLVFSFSGVFAQIYSHTFGTTAISTHPYNVAPGTLDPNLSSSSWSNSYNAWTSFAGSGGAGSIAIALNSSSAATATITLTFNVAAGYELAVTSFNFWRQRSTSGYQNWSMTINGIAVGSGTVPTTGAAIGSTNVSNTVANQTGTITVVLTLSTASGTTGTFRLDDFTLNGSVTSTAACVSASQPSSSASTLSFSNIGCTSMTLNWVNGDGAKNLVVVRAGSAVAGTPTDQTAYTANTVFGSGSIIAANEYVVYNGTGTSVTVTGLSANTTYHIRIFGFNGTGCPASGENYLTTSSLSGSQITLAACTCPQLTGVLINSCQGSCQEGDNEILFLNSGSYSIPVSPSNIIVKYENTSPATVNFTESFTTNATYVNNLNTASGCGTLFYDASAVGTIPPNTEFLIMKNTACYGYDFSSFCGSGPIYILFTTDASWSSSGNFSNSCPSPAALRYFRTDFTGIGACVTDYSFDPCQLSSFSDGDAVSFSAGGGAASNYFNSGCTPPPTVLPINLISFDGERVGRSAELKWKTASEVNNDYFSIERSIDGKNFRVVGSVKGNGTTNEVHAYRFVDGEAPRTKLYYRLKQTDYDGTATLSPIISLRSSGSVNGLFALNQSSEGKVIEFHDKHEAATIMIFDIAGRIIFSQDLTDPAMSFILPAGFSRGLYLIQVKADGLSAVEKFWTE